MKKTTSCQPFLLQAPHIPLILCINRKIVKKTVPTKIELVSPRKSMSWTEIATAIWAAAMKSIKSPVAIWATLKGIQLIL